MPVTQAYPCPASALDRAHLRIIQTIARQSVELLEIVFVYLNDHEFKDLASRRLSWESFESKAYSGDDSRTFLSWKNQRLKVLRQMYQKSL